MTKTSKLSDSDKKDIIEQYQSGKTCIEIGNIYELSDGIISRFLRNNNIHVRTAAEQKIFGKKDEFTEQRCIEMYNNGVPTEKIATHFGICRTTIYRILDKNNVVRRTKDENNKFKLSDEQREEVKKLYENGLSVDKIKDRLKLPRKTVMKYILSIGIMRKGTDYIKDKIYSQDDLYFDIIDTEDKSYFMGLLYSDGSLTDGMRRVSLCLKESDKYIIELFLKKLKTSRPIYVDKLSLKNPNHSDSCIVKIGSEHMCEVLNNYGMVPRKSLIKKFPEVILNSDEEIQRHFIRGYFDGNGSIGYANNSSNTPFFIIYSTENMCLNFKNVIEKYLGIYDMSIAPHENIFLIRTHKVDNIIKICKWLYKDCNYFLTRKYSKFMEIKMMKT